MKLDDALLEIRRRFGVGSCLVTDGEGFVVGTMKDDSLESPPPSRGLEEAVRGHQTDIPPDR